jgi:iron complex outermembrane recepter protein
MQTAIGKKVMPSLLFFLSFLFLGIQGLAQAGTLTGKVTDEAGNPLRGATVHIRSANQSATTNEQGDFSFANVPQSGTLIVTYVGYRVQEIRYQNRQVGTIKMEENISQTDEVVVTGVFDRRKRMEASVAISTLNDRQLSRIVPSSSVELLRNLPGVFVNASRGEIGSSVYTRGLSVGGGFYYVSMQEEGLPVMVISGATQPDAFLRADATIARVEAVRGGTASILGANAPGGIFNYVSKVGGQKFGGEVRTRLGLEGNGRNPYYRGDVNIGGPLNRAGDLTYNLGGFYRHANGPKYPGYPLSFGGQVKGNIQKSYKSGSLKLYAKLLNDNTAQFEMTPTVDWNNPRPAGRFTNTSSTLIQPVQFTVPGAVWSRQQGVNFNTRDVGNYRDYAVGLNWEQRFGNGWTINNMARFSDKKQYATTTAVVFPFRVDQLTFYGVSGNVGRFGTYNFYDPATGKSYGTVQQLPPTSPGPPRVIAGSISLPGSEVLPNALFYNPAAYGDLNMSEFIDQLMVTKKLKNMSFTAGGYFSRSRTDRFSSIPAGQGFATIEDRPKLVAIKYTDLRGMTHDLTDRNGIANYGSSGFYTNDATVNQSALFFGHNWQISQKLNLDWGFRYESLNINAKFTTPRRLPDSKTGADGDSLTLYDNRVWAANPERGFDKTVNTLSYSAGLNYKVSERLAFYGRYSKGQKSPDLAFFMDIANQQLTADIRPEAQDINMIEAGVKLRSEKMNLFITPFLSIVDNIPNFQIFQNPDQSYYAPPRRYQKVRTMGVEVEGAYEFSKNFSIRAVGVVQGAKALRYGVYLARAAGPQDDSLVVYNGNKLDNVPPVMLMLTPTYTAGPFYASVNYQYMGKRWANVANAFQLPAFSQVDLNMGYNVSKAFQLSASINNLFNTYGVMSWAAPGGFPASLDVQGFTKTMRAANENSVYSTLSIMPRAYFLTATYKF